MDLLEWLEITPISGREIRAMSRLAGKKVAVYLLLSSVIVLSKQIPPGLK